MKKSHKEIKDDYTLFMDIQIGKYLRKENKSEFTSEIEVDFILSKIIKTYNEKIASDHLRLDNLNHSAKVSWFNSIEIDFEEPPIFDTPNDKISGPKERTKNFTSFFNDLFPYLPKDAVIYLLNAGPAFEASGYSLDRFKDILEGAEPTEFEEDLLLWAYELSFEISRAYIEKNKKKKEDFIANSIAIALEELDEKTAVSVVAEIYANYEESFDEFKNEENKLGKRKRKRKK